MQFGQGFKETVTRAAPVGGVVGDTAYLIGAEILVATADALATEDAVFVKRGLVLLPAVSGDVPADGGICYLNATTHEVGATPGATLYPCGARSADHPEDDGVAYVGVDLDGVVAKVVGVPGDIQGVTAGTGLTGGGTSGTVTVALTAEAIASLGKADTAVQPAALVLATATTDAVACNGNETLVTTKALTTAAGASEVLVVTNSSLVAGKAPQVTFIKGTNTKAAMMKAVDYDVSAHTITLGLFSSEDSNALDGTMKFLISLRGVAT